MKKLLTSSNPLYQKSLRLYGRYQKYVPIVSFFGGVSWDNLTLSRIDRLFDSMFLLCYILLLGSFIVLFNLVEKQILQKPIFLKYREWYPNIIQFLLGGLFSAYAIYYRQSASLTGTAIFFAILIILLIANEFLKNRLANIYFQMSLYFLASFSFFIFFLPVITKIMNVFMFLAGGILSLALVIGMLYFLFRQTALKSREEFRRVTALIASIYILLNLFYFLNWIPPIPLSLKFGGVYHQVQRVEDQYRLAFEKPRWYQFFKDSDDPFHYSEGDTVYCFTSVFAPTQLKVKIFHHWQKYSEQRGEWETTDRISFPITGGRDGGYRGYSLKRNATPGQWRINVETENELLLGRIDFDVEAAGEKEYPLKTIYH